MLILFNAVFVFCVDIHAIYNSKLPCLHILILLRSQIRNVVKPYPINGYRTHIYPGTTQILLTTNVNTLLLFHKLSSPLTLGAISLAIDVNMDTSN